MQDVRAPRRIIRRGAFALGVPPLQWFKFFYYAYLTAIHATRPDD
jgi:hypothetical protein